MAKIYSKTNRIRIVDIPDKYAIPRVFKAKASEVHGHIIAYIYSHYKNTKKFKQQAVDAINRLTYCILENELPSFDWISSDPINTMPNIDINIVENTLGDFFLTVDAIEWEGIPEASDLTESFSSELAKPILDLPVEIDIKEPAKQDVQAASAKAKSSSSNPKKKEEPKVSNKPLKEVKEQIRQTPSKPTPKEDLYIQPPRCPRFDISKVWMSATVGADNLVIYTTLPEIPTCQTEISVTTDPSRMTTTEYMRLYPNQLIRTRAAAMYDTSLNLDYDEDVGIIIPIEGFSKEQVLDNIFKYPHLFKLKRLLNDDLDVFFKYIELNGELYPVDEVWDNLPESRLMPRNSEFVKEYVIRRYLLERDNGVSHKYPLYGSLDPFLTLFIPSANYAERGYTDVLGIVKQCVMSRIRYKQTRNPILKRIEESRV